MYENVKRQIEVRGADEQGGEKIIKWRGRKDEIVEERGGGG